MVTSYSLPEGFTDFDMFTFGSALLVEEQKLQWGTSVTLVVIVWVLSVFWAFLPLTGWGDYDFEPLRTCCTLDYSKGDRNYTTYVLTLTFFYLIIPSLTMLTSYQSIYKQFKKTGKYRVLPVLAKTTPAFHALLYSFGSESYRAGIWQFLSGQKMAQIQSEKSK
ncbi:hypothetical protein JZ751_007782 [Albula glossodonta]|uniref:G-protein coupled receptors family 1 profile domain-containing protein n=1 Tax=Albula glossodonta TaxID=121402 RepID=A0A8T2PB93_9TELE|nr:hypothetical protein JZ751_007782 [Albula glossodonta]